MAVIQSRLTLGVFLCLPEEKPALEFEDGEVAQKVSPKLPHSALQGAIYDAVNPIGRPGRLRCGWASSSPGSTSRSTSARSAPVSRPPKTSATSI